MDSLISKEIRFPEADNMGSRKGSNHTRLRTSYTAEFKIHRLLLLVLVNLPEGWVRSSSRCFPFSFELSLGFSFSGSWGFQSRNFLREALLPLSAYSVRVTTYWANVGMLAKLYAAWYASVMGLSRWNEYATFGVSSARTLQLRR